MATFISIVEHDRTRGYVASFPDFPGCRAVGASLDIVIGRAKEALAAHIQQLLDANQQICAPTLADAIELGNASLLVAIDIPDDIGVVRIDVEIPVLTLVRIDSFAQRHGLTRAALFVEAVNRWSAPEIERRGGGGESFEGPTLFDFSNPLELKVEPVAADDRPEIERDGHQAAEDPGPGESEDITAEVARLFEGGGEVQPTEGITRSAQANPGGVQE